MKNVLVTGVSSGIGLSLVKEYLSRGCVVYGLSRRKCEVDHENFHFISADLSDFTNIPGKMFELLGGLSKLDTVVLNAGILGDIADMSQVSIVEMKKTMDINLWSNKVVLDWLFKHIKVVDQVIAISSGAAVNGNRGWNGYSISKAALNMLVKLYASEKLDTHFCALAPGLVDTAMQDYLCSQKETDKYPSLERIQSSRGTEAMPTAEQLAAKLIETFTKVKSLETGCFVDIRKM
ncbi:MAG: SDR family NAD(P)-dependent oxidoreductase [Lentisphaeraceae bacterium]|nr:SDR family NAD(P)-dependent oxidoreductase [Lentisphaeraceae bacterium]